jgi:hypothetical protein
LPEFVTSKSDYLAGVLKPIKSSHVPLPFLAFKLPKMARYRKKLVYYTKIGEDVKSNINSKAVRSLLLKHATPYYGIVGMLYSSTNQTPRYKFIPLFTAPPREVISLFSKNRPIKFVDMYNNVSLRGNSLVHISTVSPINIATKEDLIKNIKEFQKELLVFSGRWGLFLQQLKQRLNSLR